MEWYRKLYLSEGLEGKKDKLISKIEKNAGTRGIYLITLASNQRDLFDIFSADLMFQNVLHGHCPMIVGLAETQEEAVSMMADLVIEMYQKNSNFNVKAFLEEQITDGKGMTYQYPMEKLKRRKRLFSLKKNYE